MAGASGTEVQRFEGKTFDSALRQAAQSGVLKSVCLEKQIAFMARSLPARHADPPEDPTPNSLTDNPPPEAFFPRMTAAISALLHETQRERGTSSLYLSSRGRLFAHELHDQWRLTDARRTDLMLFRRQHTPDFPAELVRKLERAEDMLGELCAGRAEIESLQLVPAQVIHRYSNANGQLLSVIDGLAQRSVNTALRPTALAWMALLHAKEKTGLERAELATAFSRDHYAEGQHATVSALIAASDSYLHVFSTAAPRSASELLRKQLHSEAANAVTEMEKVALLKREGGFGIDPTAWFANMSRKMDLLTDVECAVRQILT
ncbi:MAG: nitrate- and nitrite sensing domain-containing protein [Deltaproteobacteria bacterium]|nr:nitrate- and nitrite sensing domain-containing protein [Deltaproteobacteria bacterium]